MGKGASGIVSVVSRQAGTVAGTSVVISKKIAGCGVKSVTSAKDWLGRPLKILMPARDKKNTPTSEAPVLKPADEQETGRKKAARALIAALESDLTVAQRESKKAQSKAEKTHSKLTSQLRELEAEKESLISDLELVKNKANEAAAREDQAKTRVTGLESDIVAAQHHLERSCEEEAAKSEPPSELNDVRSEEEIALSDQVEEKVEVVSTEEEVESMMEPAVAQSIEELSVEMQEQPVEEVFEAEMPGPADVVVEEDIESAIELAVVQSVEQQDLSIEEQLSEEAIEVEVPNFAEVTAEDVQTAVFPNATDRIIFTTILSDLSCQNAAVRLDVAKTIANLPHPLSVRALAAHMRREPSPQVRQECVNSLTKLEMAEGLEAVKCALADKAAAVRLAAVWGLYRLGGAASTSELVSVFSDVDEEVRRRAVTCIGWLGQEAFAIKLLPLLNDSSASVRRATVEAMGSLHSRQVVLCLIEQLNDPVESIRKAILSALKAITGKRMSGPFPRNEESLQHLIVRWRQWWKAERLEAVAT